jgi:hypothetical protein
MLGLPAYQALLVQDIPLGFSDYILTALVLFDTALEFTADNQQWSYQNFKQSGVVSNDHWPGANIQWTEDDRKRGFVTRGLWAWSRHPNCACEQTFWVCIASPPVYNRAHRRIADSSDSFPAHCHCTARQSLVLRTPIHPARPGGGTMCLVRLFDSLHRIYLQEEVQERLWSVPSPSWHVFSEHDDLERSSREAQR